MPWLARMEPGKSTLIKIISGAYVPDQGEIELDGDKVAWTGPREAQGAGIHVIYQELVLFPELTVAENVFINDQPLTRFGIIDYRLMERRADDALRRLGAKIDVRRRVKELTVADQQMVEIARALVGSVKVLILDEPTAVISGREVDLLFDRLIALRAAGVAIIYISHRLEEIFRIADRVTVLKDGVRVATRPVTEVNRDQLISLMVGRALSDVFPPRRAIPQEAPVLLRAEGIRVGTRVRNASFTLRSGEIVGLAGLVGSGRTELAQAIFGGVPFDAGKVEIEGTVFAKTSPRSSIEAGVGLLTEDRKGEGLLMHLSVAANIVAPRLSEIARGPFIDLRAENRDRCAGDREIFRCGVRAAGRRRRPVGRKPTESAVQPMGPGLSPRAVARRADARRRCGRQGRNLSHHTAVGRCRICDIDDQFGTARDCRHVRSGSGDVRRSDYRRAGRRRYHGRSDHDTGVAAMTNNAESTLPRLLALQRRLARWVGPAVVIEVGVIVLLFVIGFAVSENFRTPDNAVNIFEQTTGLAFVALGQTVVILSGGIDLSLDANIALTSSLLSGVVNGRADLAAPMIAAVLAIGLTIGLVNGALILLLRVHPLIVTLAVAAVVQGITLLYTLMPIGGMPDGFDVLAFGRVFGIPIGATFAVLCFAVVAFVLAYTRPGRQIFAFGGEPAAARLVGVPVRRVVLFVYGLVWSARFPHRHLSGQPARRRQPDW